MQRPKVVPSLSGWLGIDWSNVKYVVDEAATAWNTYNAPAPKPKSAVPQTMLGGTTGTLVLVGGALLLGYAVLSGRRR